MTANTKKLIIYAVSALVSFIIAFLVSFIPFDETALYAVFFGLLGAGLGVVIARVVYHCIIKDFGLCLWAVSFDLLIACAGWLIACLATTVEFSSIGLALAVFGLTMAYGNRFVSVFESVVETSKELTADLKKKGLDSDKATKLITELRYAFIGDDPSLGVDKARPLCLINGVAHTCAEAYEDGHGAMAADALQYITTILAKEEKETEEE